MASTPLLEEMLVRITASESASGREIYQLLQQNLLRRGEANGRPTVETYHDRVREAAVAHEAKRLARKAA